MPNKWKKKENIQATYGTQAVYGAEDSVSDSDMVVLIFPKSAVEEDGFGERTRKELAQNNHYKKVEDVYMKEYKINEATAYKYTFETIIGEKRKWAHYYCVFSEHGVIQMMYYSAQDSGYEDRVKMIDASMDTLKETNYDKEQEKNAEQTSEAGNIVLNGEQSIVTISGLRQIKGEGEEKLLAIRFSLENTGEKAISASEWGSHVFFKQNNQPLSRGELPKTNTSYELETLLANTEKKAEPKEILEGVFIFKLQDESKIELTMDNLFKGERTNYSLSVPEKK